MTASTIANVVASGKTKPFAADCDDVQQQHRKIHRQFIETLSVDFVVTRLFQRVKFSIDLAKNRHNCGKNFRGVPTQSVLEITFMRDQTTLLLKVNDKPSFLCSNIDTDCSLQRLLDLFYDMHYLWLWSISQGLYRRQTRKRKSNALEEHRKPAKQNYLQCTKCHKMRRILDDYFSVQRRLTDVWLCRYNLDEQHNSCDAAQESCLDSEGKICAHTKNRPNNKKRRKETNFKK